ncbi:MAG TPA: glycosyltransferase family 39 protein, partial [Chthoniobacterales bacterium]
MRFFLRSLKEGITRHPGLAAALCLALLLSVIGMNWGRVECWNPDQMAHRKISNQGLPKSYLKPPLHTYLNYGLVVWPVERVMGGILRLDKTWQYPVLLAGSRLITLAMFAASVALLYGLALGASGKTAATVLALWAATSAGFIAFNHYLTADMPLIFWMLASLFMAVRAAKTGRTLDAALAGLLAGLAAADKYNGLGVAAAIPAALFAAQGWRFIRRPAPWVAGLAVLGGFALGNPGAVFDAQRFVEDFQYNLLTTPVYTGKTEGSGYLAFLRNFPMLLGWPATVLLAAALGIAGGAAVMRRWRREEAILVAAAAVVFGFYFMTIGRFPRMATRFVLPAVPFLMLCALPALRLIPWRHPALLATAAALLVYNLACCLETGRHYLDDPRMAAQEWVKARVPEGARVENTYAPAWNKLRGVRVKAYSLPQAKGRVDRFNRLFEDNEIIQKGLSRYETGDSGDTFTEAALKRRNPDFITYTSFAFDYTGNEAALEFYRKLDAQSFGYRKVFDQRARPIPWWSYPQNLDFIPARMVILQRDGPAS